MIIICDECGQYFCSSACPNFTGFIVGLGHPTRRCSLCDNDLYRGDAYYICGERTVCENCAQQTVSPELLDLLDCYSTDDFFEMLRIPRCEA